MKFDVQIGCRAVGAIGEMHVIKRHYVIEANSRSEVNAEAIKRAYQDGDVEHVRVECVEQIS